MSRYFVKVEFKTSFKISVFLNQKYQYSNTKNISILTPQISVFLHQKYQYSYTKNISILTPKISVFLHQKSNLIKVESI